MAAIGVHFGYTSACVAIFKVGYAQVKSTDTILLLGKLSISSNVIWRSYQVIHFFIWDAQYVDRDA